MKRIIIVFICSCIFIISLIGSSVNTLNDSAITQDSKLSNISFSDSTRAQIPIIAWGGLGLHSTIEMYKDLADAGFSINFSYDLRTADAEKAKFIFSALDKANAANVKQLIGAVWLDYLSEQDVARLKTHPGLAGYWFYDEPRTYKEITFLKTWVDRVKLIDNDHLLYINLAGCNCRGAKWAPELLGCTEREPSPCARFVKIFADEVDIPMISVDHYTVVIDTTIKQRKLQPDYYYTLETMSREAKRTNKEFWSFALATEHNHSTIVFPIPTINDLRLQMYSNLAYGAQALQYYTYIHRPHKGFGKAPLDADGSKTSTYYLIQKMNKEIQAISRIFLGSKVKWVAHTGNIPDGTIALDKSILPQVFDSFDITGASGALVSLLEKGEDNFLVIVNRDINETLSVKSTGRESLYRINKKGAPVVFDNDAQHLEPGDVCIFFWKN